jgi:hypothetical protein
VPVYDIEVNPAKKTLFAGTHARSILSFPLDSLNLGGDVSTENPDLFKRPALLVSPSLADQSTVIAIEHLSLKKRADIAVFDLSGRLMRRFELRGGSRSEMPLELQDFAPGVYVAVARTDGKVWGQRKFVVAR